MKNKFLFPKILLALGALLALVLLPHAAEAFQALTDREQLATLWKDHPIAAMGTFFSLLFVQVPFPIIPGPPLMLAGGYVFGFARAFLISAPATILSSQVAFWLGSRFGLNLVKQFIPKEKAETLTGFIGRMSLWLLALQFFLPTGDLTCWIAGACQVSPRKFLLANILGRVPVTALLAYLGDQGGQIPWGWMVGLAIIFGGIAGWNKLAPRLPGLSLWKGGCS
ncbi:MAG: TVP38/TMEM64 family protein [Anaerolineales bacterium]|nr:TVP38/TMEM64 family protein [Anaerolineales bacterium]